MKKYIFGLTCFILAFAVLIMEIIFMFIDRNLALDLCIPICAFNSAILLIFIGFLSMPKKEIKNDK